MTDNITQLPGTEKPNIVGAYRFGNRVVVEGRVIPGLAVVQKDEVYDLYLDDRFCIEVSEEQIIPVSWMVANALAVGAGYTSIQAETKDRPFAPQVTNLGEI